MKAGITAKELTEGCIKLQKAMQFMSNQIAKSMAKYAKQDKK